MDAQGHAACTTGATGGPVATSRSERKWAERGNSARLGLVLACQVLALGCAHAPAGSPAAPAPVALRFDWPEGFTAEVLARQEQESWGSDPVRSLSRRTLVTARQGQDIVVRSRSAPGEEGRRRGKAERLTDGLGEVVRRDGTFVRADGVEGALDLVRHGGEVPVDVARRGLERSLATDWEILAGAWAGRSFVRGQPQHKRFAGSVPLMATAETLLDVTLTFEGFTPCSTEETEPRCVELRYHARTAPSARAATLARIGQVIAATPGRPVVREFHDDLDVTLVTEPATLIPHRIVDRESLRIRMRMEDGHEREAEERSEDEYVFAPSTGSAPEAGAPARSGSGRSL